MTCYREARGIAPTLEEALRRLDRELFLMGVEEGWVPPVPKAVRAAREGEVVRVRYEYPAREAA